MLVTIGLIIIYIVGVIVAYKIVSNTYPFDLNDDNRNRVIDMADYAGVMFIAACWPMLICLAALGGLSYVLNKVLNKDN